MILDELPEIGIRAGNLAETGGIAIGKDLVGLRVDDGDLEDCGGIRDEVEQVRGKLFVAQGFTEGFRNLRVDGPFDELGSDGIDLVGEFQGGFKLLLYVVGEVDRGDYAHHQDGQHYITESQLGLKIHAGPAT